MPGHTSSFRQHLRRMMVPYLVLVLALSVTAYAARRVRLAVENQERERFESVAQSAYQALGVSVEYDLNAVRSLQGFFHSRGDVSAEEWKRFLTSLNWRRNYPNQLDLGFARRVPGTNGAPERFAIVYLDSKLADNQHALGFDLATQNGQRETIERARATTAPTASPVIDLCRAGSTNRHPGTMIYLPVFRGGAAPAKSEERRATLAGFVFNSVVITNVYRSIARGRTNQLLVLQIGEAHGPPLGTGLSPVQKTAEGRHEMTLTTMGVGRPWEIRFTELAGFEADSSRRLPGVVWLAGGLFSVLLFGLTAVQATGRARADRLNEELRQSEGAIQQLNKELEQRVHDRTAEFVHANDRLQKEIADRGRSEAALRETEELYRRAISAADAVPYRRDYSTETFSFIGEGIQTLTGYNAAEMTPQLWDSVVKESCLQGELAGLEIEDAIRRVRSGEFTRWRDDCRIRTKSGATRWVSDCSVEILGADGKPTGSIGFLMDITERKRAEEELVKSLAMEKELGRLRSNFVSMVSHEFRTPLGIIMSSGEILDRYFDRLTPEARREHLVSIHEAVNRMARMMEDVLLLGRVEAGKLECKPVPIDLVAFCQRLADEILSATHRKCPIAFEAQPLPGLAQADEGLLRHIFTNLLTNAVKYSPEGRSITFSVQAEQDAAVLAVRDQGVGIAPEDRDRLFTAFHRGQNVSHIPGTGLGLTIVKRCVELHRGKIFFRDADGGGTVFTVTLPLFANQTTNPCTTSS